MDCPIWSMCFSSHSPINLSSVLLMNYDSLLIHVTSHWTINPNTSYHLAIWTHHNLTFCLLHNPPMMIWLDYLILPTIWPYELTPSIHFVILPLTMVLPSISPLILSLSIDHITYELSFISTSIHPYELTISFFLPIHIFTYIFRTIWPTFLSFPLLFVFHPLSTVFSTITM